MVSQYDSQRIMVFLRDKHRQKTHDGRTPNCACHESAIATSARWSPKQSMQNINPGVHEQ